MKKYWIFLLFLSACGGSGNNGGGVQPGPPIIPIPPPASIQTQQVFAGVNLSAPTALRQAPADDTRWFAIEQRGVARSMATRLTPPPRSVSVLAGGDVLTEERVRFAAANAGKASGARFDFGPMFTEVREAVETADLAICHMETPIGAPGGSFGYAGRSPFGGNLLQALENAH